MWTFDPTARRQLTNSESNISKKLKSTDSKVLEILFIHQGKVVSKQELLDVAWAGRVVTQSSLVQSIAQLRMALGDSGREQKIIKTVPNQGYKLVEGSIEMLAVELPERPLSNYRTTQEPDAVQVGESVTLWQKSLILCLVLLLAFWVIWLLRMAYYNWSTERVQWQSTDYNGVQYFYSAGTQGNITFNMLKDRYPSNILMLYFSGNPEQLYVSCIYTSQTFHERTASNMSFSHNYSVEQVKGAIREQCQ
ncbi:winged helix-turn-helix domain-containing protein [Vibrio sp. CAU 1672]|uniref:winged helix-turn-helix domain-containing protein n=1 Tax=Vibrio sp. CAU 1672 TaxID=3032594 RepID=UPI0023DBEBD9|nr:winged helix-turn-helix domain-containing protein [Vibrio sp. CAU 1672]MDF2152823.1 winged helix-turn-helix domain-containing protein [Vibrio sp. CAU 1672]